MVWLDEVDPDGPLIVALGREAVVELTDVVATGVIVGELLDGKVTVLGGVSHGNWGNL